ncbi:MAG: hypothetical protein ACFFBD_09010 [Candidatus Hodarchaeota archaeon]
MTLPPHHRHGRAKVLAKPRRRARARDRGFLAHGQYDRVGTKPENFWPKYSWVKSYDRKKNRHHDSTARKLVYRRLTKLKRTYNIRY